MPLMNTIGHVKTIPNDVEQASRQLYSGATLFERILKMLDRKSSR